MVSEGKGEELGVIKGRQGGVNEGRGEANGERDKLYSTITQTQITHYTVRQLTTQHPEECSSV